MPAPNLLDHGRSTNPAPRVLADRLKRRSWSDRVRALSAWCAWGYLALAVGVLCLLRFAGDRWWPATLLTFGPRWIVLAPLPILVPPMLLCQRRHWLPLGAAGALVIGPIMGYCVPWHWPADSKPSQGAAALCFVTYNAGERGNDPQRLGEFVARILPDVMTINEWGQGPPPPCFDKDWHVVQKGPVLFASRFPIVRVEPLNSPRLEPWSQPATRFDIETEWGVIHVVGVHLETPREGIEELVGSRGRDFAAMEQTSRIRETESELARELAAAIPGPTIVAGDFNMPVDSAIYRRDWSGWQNAFSAAGLGFGYTKFTRWFAVRIDHILADASFRIVSASVCPGLGGDHHPVVSSLELKRTRERAP